MKRSLPWSALAGLVLSAAWLPVLRADDPPAEKWQTDSALTVTRMPAPVPVLKYRLYPSTMDRKDGNAVPIYERLAHERSDAYKKQLQSKPAEWNKLPLDKLPLAEVKTFLDGYKYNFKQIDLAARRKTADWNYTLDAGDMIGLLLPDVQDMRIQGAMLALKARFEIAEGRYSDAIRTLETGFAFSQQLAPTPFLICGLVGIAIAHQMNDCVLEMVQRPDAPNLYWALSVLPQPLFDLRQEYETEQRLLEMQWPIMADLDRPRTPEQWDAALAQIRSQILFYGEGAGSPNGTVPMKAKPIEPAAKSPDLPIARKYLTETVHLTGVDAMPPAQVLLLYTSHYYHELRDDAFMGIYLPFAQARPLGLAAEERLKKSAHDTEAGRLAKSLLPAILKVTLAQVRIERKLAAMRAIEALRLHVAKTGELPDKLEQVTIVPVPNDPGTGKEFEYKRDGQTFTLTSRIAGEPLETTGLRYRVTIRK